MEAPFHMSGLDLGRGLMRIGYRMTGNACGYLLLERGSRAVTIPLLDDLQPALLRFLLLAAGVSLPQVKDALEGRGSSPPPPRQSGIPTPPVSGVIALRRMA